KGLHDAALAIVVVAWPSYARVVRGLVLSVGDSEYVQSARLLGASARRALVRDVVPNVAGPVLVLATLDLANAILLLSGLSFLGLGAQPPQGEVFGVAGESGSGKTISMLALLGLLPEGANVEGSVRFGGNDLLRLPRARLREVAGRDIGMVFQDPYTSLHPMLSIGRQLTEH